MTANEPLSGNLAIIGAGAWGTALAFAAARAGRTPLLWGRDAAGMAEMARTRRHARHLPEIELPAAIRPTGDSSELQQHDLALLVVPAQTAEATISNLLPVLARLKVLVLCCKGIRAGTAHFLSQGIAALLPQVQIAALSGPSFAADVARGLPTAVTLAIDDKQLGAILAALIGSPTLRPYWSSDLRGVEIGGALKNVYAIASGIVTGRDLGDSARAAIIARSFAEMSRFGLHFGARSETLAGLSGLGDLVLTATGQQSRNLRFGQALGQGLTVDRALASIGTVEGAATAGAVHSLAVEHSIDMPIAGAVAAIVNNRLSVEAAIDGLLSRPLRPEA